MEIKMSEVYQSTHNDARLSDTKNNSLQNLEITDSSSLHKYRTELPNIIFELGLDPYEFSLYCLFKKIAGDNGTCWKSTKNLAKESGMSVRKLISTKHKLALPRDELDGFSLLTITPRITSLGDPDTDVIRITDLWLMNFQKNFRGTAQHAGGVLHEVHTNKNPIKEDPYKETTTNIKPPDKPKPKTKSASPPVVVSFSTQGLDLSRKAMKQAFSVYTQKEIDLAIQRTLGTKNRESDTAVFLHWLKNPEKWVDVTSKEDVIAKNKEHLASLSHLDHKTIAETRIDVGYRSIAFICGNNYTEFDIDQKDFIFLVNKNLEKLKKLDPEKKLE